MTHLSVNVNKLATLRNSREKNRPDVVRLSRLILECGAHGITVHPRPDGRHIRTADVTALAALLSDWNARLPMGKTAAEFNIEGYPSEDLLALVERTRPAQCTLVPDPPDALTSNAGWKLAASETLLRPVLARLARINCRVSLFVDPAAFSATEQAALERMKPARIELYTEAFAEAFLASSADRERVTAEYLIAATWARAHGIGVNAGHDLDQRNLGFLLKQIPWIDEVSIGHALICEALEDGLSTTVKHYLQIVEGR